MDDLISRADVEQTVEDNILCYTHSDRLIDQDPDMDCHMAIRTALRMLRKDLRKLPSAQPEPIKISVDHAMTEEELKELKQKIADSPVVLLPSAEPPYNLDEWCYDCKEYDQERHCCPRFNRVIKQTKEDFEAQNEIIYCKDCQYHGMAICRIWSRYGTINTPGYGFCFRGERRTDETD